MLAQLFHWIALFSLLISLRHEEDEGTSRDIYEPLRAEQSRMNDKAPRRKIGTTSV